MEATVIISLCLMFGTMGYVIGRDVYQRFIKPFTSYKLVIYDTDDEYTFYKKKKDAIIRQGIKGFVLFDRKKSDEENPGEFYTLPIDKEFKDVNDKFSKRDDRGFITFYYYRNNTTPININPSDRIRMVENDARTMNKVLKSNIFDSSITIEEPPKNTSLIVVIVIVAVVLFLAIAFQDKIAGLFGGGA